MQARVHFSIFKIQIPLMTKYIRKKVYSLTLHLKHVALKTSGSARKFSHFKTKCPGSLAVRRRSRKPFLLWESAGSNLALGASLYISACKTSFLPLTI